MKGTGVKEKKSKVVMGEERSTPSLGGSGWVFSVHPVSSYAPSLGEGRGGLPRGIYIHNGKKIVIR